MTLTVEQRRRVERAKPLVDQMARALSRRLARVTEDELRSAGYEALVKCGLRYDPALGASFRAFSFRRIRGAMIDTARKAIPGLRQRGRALRVLHATQALLEHDEIQREDAPDPRALHERVAAAADLVAQTTAAVVLSRMIDDPDEVPDEAAGDLEEQLLDDQLRLQIRRTLLRCCTEDERAMLTALYEEGLTMTELGERLGISKSTISRKHASLLRRLGKQLGADPDSS